METTHKNWLTDLCIFVQARALAHHRPTASRCPYEKRKLRNALEILPQQGYDNVLRRDA